METTQSQRDSIFLHLLNGGRISLENAATSKFYWCHRLPARIHEIKKVCDVERVMIQGVRSRYAEYFINPEFLKTAKAKRLKRELEGKKAA